MASKPRVRYKDAGVNIDVAERAVDRIKKHARATLNARVLTSIGSFGAGYLLTGWKKPVLVSSADGVGTKLKIAFMTGRHDTIGEDLVNHCVNDIMVQAASPLFFLDYFATGKLDAGVAERVVGGIARGCASNGCALIGGETAEMPGFCADGEYDLAGFIVGAVERSRLLTGSKIQPGDVLLGLPSSGLHTNGYSLARKLLFDVGGYTPETYLDELGCTVADELLKVHKSYRKALGVLLAAGVVKGAAHITGGGITDNLPRILPDATAAVIETAAWRVPPVFTLLERLGNMPHDDYRRTFNLGIGMVLAVPLKRVRKARFVLDEVGEPHAVIGRVIKQPPRSRRRVIYE